MHSFAWAAGPPYYASVVTLYLGLFCWLSHALSYIFAPCVRCPVLQTSCACRPSNVKVVWHVSGSTSALTFCCLQIRRCMYVWQQPILNFDQQVDHGIKLHLWAYSAVVLLSDISQHVQRTLIIRCCICGLNTSGCNSVWSAHHYRLLMHTFRPCNAGGRHPLTTTTHATCVK